MLAAQIMPTLLLCILAKLSRRKLATIHLGPQEPGRWIK